MKGERFKMKIVGREKEFKIAISALNARRHILLEGPVGVGKTQLGMYLARYMERPFFRVDGDESYTEYKLVGWFDPPLVITKGYSEESFIPGPLTRAMREGGILFINELNRMPEGTQNVLLPAMDEGCITVPKLGPVVAEDPFRIIATQNPEEFVGTNPLSEALKDRFIQIRLDYQTFEEEVEIVRRETGCRDRDLVNFATALVRRTRSHPEIRRGSSVRGAVDFVCIAQAYGDSFFKLDGALLEEVAKVALSTKVEMHEKSYDKLDAALAKIIEDLRAEGYSIGGPAKSERGKLLPQQKKTNH